MLKHTLIIAGALVALASSTAFAETRSWNVTEETADGIKNAQGVWTAATEGEKIAGSADMTLNAGDPLSYKLDGSVKDGVYTINLVGRSDGKKACVWSGHKPSSGGTQTSGLTGNAQCDGAKLVIRASF